jgi:hypothetical protein
MTLPASAFCFTFNSIHPILGSSLWTVEEKMSILFILIPFIGIILLISGGIGLFIVNLNYPVGDLLWMQGNLTYGIFTLIGLAVTISYMVSGLERE